MRKSILYKYILAGAVVVSMISCRKNFLDQVPDDRINIDGVFQSKKETEKYLANVYGYIRDEYYQMWDYGESSPWLGCSDEGDMTWARGNGTPSGYNTYFMNIGAWTPSSDFYNNWSWYYRGVRSATYFLQRVDECTEMVNDPTVGPEGVKIYKAEARFLRAWFYFNLVKQYGPVILLNENEVVAPDVPLSDLQLPRNSFDECVTFITTELDKALADLPLTITNTNFYGRPTKGAALAVKARLLLYAASPLFNGNIDYAGMKNADGKQLISQTNDANKWKKAADAAKAVIDLNQYSLYNSDPNPLRNFQQVFTNMWNSEVIFVRPNGDYGEWDYHCAPRQASGWNGVAATQQIVDAFHMANGMQINEPGSGYVETGFSAAPGTYTTAGTWNMYTNREARFYASIIYNGAYWVNTSLNIKVELYNSGASGKAGSYDYSRTGYLVGKLIHPNTNINQGQFPKRHYILCRLGEIYLDYAEALNEYSPGHADILTYVNYIRQRAGIPALPGGLSQAEMRERIRRERQVELAFEGHRYFDTRRWKIAEQTDGGQFWGMNVDKGTSFTDASFYTRTVFETRLFQKKHYLFPIPQSEIDKDRALVQNSGW